MKKLTLGLVAALAMAAAQGAPAKKAQETVGPEAALKPLVSHVAQPRTMIDLCGEWDFAMVKCTEAKVPDPKDDKKTVSIWNRTDVKDFGALAWEKVTIPWGMRSMSRRDFYYFRKRVDLPQDVVGRRVILKTEKIVDTYSLIVNGTRFPARATFEMPWATDITSAVKPGANEIIIEVSNDFGRRVWADSPHQHEWALVGYWGISRPLHLEIMNPVGIDEVVVQTKVTPEKILTVKALVTNATDKAATVALGATIEEALGGDASSVGKKDGQILSPDAGMRRPPVVIPPHGSKEIVLETKWPDAKLWDPEHTNLYFVDLKLYECGRLGEATLPKGSAALGGDASSVGKKDGPILSSDAGMRQPPIDAYRERFGFREITMKGNQFLVNGKPYIHRRTTHPCADENDKNPSRERLARDIKVLREAGVTGARLFGGDVIRWATVADEVGAFLTPVAPSGWGAAFRSEKFWPVFHDYQIHMVKTFRNHPSIFAWGLGNEFGTIYGGNEGGPKEKAAQEKEAGCGIKIGKLDPTRGWTYCGEIDVSYPAKGTVGPAPIRSFHYPIGTCRDGITMPESGYWYDKGELSWHRISTKDKPLVISEDIFHGTTDQHLGMAKTGGDSIYTLDGYAKTLHYIIRSLCEGYYHSGLGGWETWVTYQCRGDKNMLNRLGALMPHYLITTRENFPNLRGGEKTFRNVFTYNQLFTPYACELVREDWFDGKMVFTETRKFFLEQGMKHQEKIVIDAPKVRKPSKYEVRFKLLGVDCRASQSDARNDDAPTAVIARSEAANVIARSEATNVIARSEATKQSQLLTERTYAYTVFPKKTEIEIEGKTALLASAESVLRKMDFARGIYATVAEVLASGAQAIVVDKILSEDEGRALNDFVLAGGKVLFIEAAETSWTPLMLECRRPMSFVWRRNDDRMKDVDESWMKAWMPDHTLGGASYAKPQADTRILWDCGQKEGLTNANVLWLNRGKGAWMLCQLPVLSRFAVEPAAPFVLQSVMDEFTDDMPEMKGKVVAAPDGSASSLLATLKIETSGKTPDRDDVLVLDASKGLGGEQLIALDAHTKNKGAVLLLEPPAGTCDDVLAKLGLKLTPFTRQTTFVWGANRPIDTTPKWLVRKNNAGLLAGITTEDMFWYGVNSMWSYMMDLMCGKTNAYFKVGEAEPIITGTLEALPGADVELLTEPAGIAVCDYNKGKVVVVNLRFSKFAAAYPQRAARVVRTLLNNLGAETVTPERVHNYAFIDISKKLNRGLWNDPLFQKKDGSFDPIGWFGDENDMRFFPVNLCGWSMAARNWCPKEAFPTEPLNLGGMKFLLNDPAKNKGRGVIILKPGESVRIDLPKGMKVQKFWFLGAQSYVENGNMLEMKLPTVKEPIVFEGGSGHFGIYRWAAAVKKGAVAWSGETLKDDQASLYNWYGANAASDKVVPWLELKNIAKKDSVAILAITAELTDK